jgi:hypothetical protein
MLHASPRCEQFLQLLHVVQAVHIPVGEHVPARDQGIMTHVQRKMMMNRLFTISEYASTYEGCQGTETRGQVCLGVGL